MFGVVLWSDHIERKAVIWCEDHGDLAFCNEVLNEDDELLETGDLIQFDVTLFQDMRLAQNLRKVSEGAYHGLADTLRMLPSDGPVAVPGGAGDDVFAAQAADTDCSDRADTGRDMAKAGAFGGICQCTETDIDVMPQLASELTGAGADIIALGAHRSMNRCMVHHPSRARRLIS